MAEIKKSNGRGGARPNAGRKPKNPPPESTTHSGPRDTRWKPGQSGNPGGRPRVVGQLRDLARAHTRTAFATLLTVCRNKDAPPAARVAAAAHILDRGYGKPPQNVNATVTHLRNMTDNELISYLTGDEQGGSGEGIAASSGDTPITH